MSVTVVVPTYREAVNIPHLIARLTLIRELAGLDLDLLIMDDDSQDGSEELVRALGLPWARLVTRKADRCLSAAVLEGLRLATRTFVVVMDADLSHPPERIPEMLETVMRGADVAVGSRFTEGGSTGHDWGLFRWLNSRVATLLATPLTAIKDPMSGFFAMRRTTLDAAQDLQPIGYKILLELIVKCRCKLVVEVPIHFDNRRFGVSKLTFIEQINYLRHLRRLYIFRYGTWSHLAQFLAVGISGAVVNLLVLSLLIRWKIALHQAVAVAILISMTWNFGLNRRFSFSYARGQPIVRQFRNFVAACSVGALVNYFTTTSLLSIAGHAQIAAIAGIVAGTLFNFTASRFLVFRSKHIVN